MLHLAAIDISCRFHEVLYHVVRATRKRKCVPRQFDLAVKLVVLSSQRIWRRHRFEGVVTLVVIVVVPEIVALRVLQRILHLHFQIHTLEVTHVLRDGHLVLLLRRRHLTLHRVLL